jgi:hypothetical protein
MEIFDHTPTSQYVSCWPAQPGQSLPLGTAMLVKSLQDDIRNEGGAPDSIIRFTQLNIPNMQSTLKTMTARLRRGEIRWQFTCSSDADITNLKNCVANCATFVYTILKAGGLGIKGNVYNSMYFRSRGPNEPFYHQTRCNLGDIEQGAFNGVFTERFFTPKALLLHAAAAAEAVPKDREATIEAMHKHSPPRISNIDMETVRILQKKEAEAKKAEGESRKKTQEGCLVQ